MAEEEMNADGFEDDDEITVVMTDEDGNESYYCEEMRLTVEGEEYALLIPAGEYEAHEHGDDCGCDAEDDEAFFAKIVTDEDGEEAYVDPTDEEFEAVLAAYDALMEEMEEEE